MNAMDPNMNNDSPASNAAPMQPVQPVMPQPVVPQPVVEPVQPVQPVQPVVDTVTEDAEVTAEKIREQLQQTLESSVPVASNAIPQPVVAPVEPTAVEPVQTASQSTASPTVGISPSAQPVTIYTIDSCPFCKAEKEYLQSKNIAFTEKKVDVDETALKEMLALSDNFAGVPVSVLTTVKEKRVVKGFTQADFEEELRTIGLIQEQAPVVAPPQPQQPQQQVVEPVVQAVPQPPISAPAVPDFPQTPQQ